MHMLFTGRRSGMTLLEPVVALVILSFAATAGLASLASSYRLARDAQAWEQAAVIAARAMEEAKSFGAARAPRPQLPAGYSQRVTTHQVAGGLVRIDVTVGLPSGQLLQVSRITAERRP